MWKNTRMIVLTALIAAVYAAVLIPFKAIPLVPGFTAIRVAQVLPPVASLLFGPVAAWGIAIGNLIGDILGSTFGLGSLFGFAGNFLLGAIPYMLWGRLGILSSNQEPTMRGDRQVLEFLVLVVVSGIACAFTIAWGLELLGLFPFTVLGSIIAINNILLPTGAGPCADGSALRPGQAVGPALDRRDGRPGYRHRQGRRPGGLAGAGAAGVAGLRAGPHGPAGASKKGA